MIRQRVIGIDDETWQALHTLAESSRENVSALARDALRAYLRKHGHTFTTEPRRYGRRGEGRQAK